MKIYISGKITGLDYDEAFRAFEAAENKVRAMGHEPVNPMKKVSEAEGLEWLDYMRQDIKLLMDCDGIYLIKGWLTSRGATIERRLAIDLGLDVIEEK